MGTVRLPVIQSARGSITSDGHRKRIVPADVHGRFDTARKWVFAFLIAVWAVLPWVHIGGAPAVLLDVQGRKFYLFGLTFNAQDTWLVFFLVSGAAFTLVYVTALAGRAWCGWACPQTVFLEGVYRKIERWIEGPREKRLRRQRIGIGTVVKHGLYALVSLLIAHIILSYFVSIPQAWAMVREEPSAHPEAFAWVLAISAVVYGNFAYFREQFCVIVCPYGRLQSVLLDDDSLIVGYDTKRGEPRGKKGQTTGDCVDCNRCVVVCPTGIDIRDGLQLDCLACTACIDACDDIMDKLGRPRGLIRYDSQNGFAGKERRVLRPRLLLYSAMLALGAGVATLAFRTRTDFEVVVARLPGAPYMLDGDSIRNAFDVHIVNKRGERDTFDLVVDAGPSIEAVIPLTHPAVNSLSDAHVPLFLTMPRKRFSSDVPVRVRVVREGTGDRDAVTANVSFLGAKL